MASNDEGKPDAVKGTRPSRVVEQVAGCDPSVRGVVVLDELGQILAGWSAMPATTTDQLSTAMVSKMGIVAKIVMGAVGKETGVWGGLDFMVAAFQNDKLLLIDMHDQNRTLVLGIPRSTMADSVYEKVAKILAATK
jgi:hypothetical protein